MTGKTNPLSSLLSLAAPAEDQGATHSGAGASVALHLMTQAGTAGAHRQGPEGRPPGGSCGSERGEAEPPPAGLVSHSTSPTRPDEILVDPRRSRLLRMRRATLTAAKEVESRPSRPGFRKPRAVGVTLTYRPGVEWREQHVSQFIERMQKWAKRRGVPVPYVWVAELQKRGAVHYHLIVWLEPHLMLPKPDKRGWWSHGMTKVERLRCGAAYASKYATKGEDGAEFPKGLRLHGRGGLDKAERMAVRWWNLAKWVREHFGECVRDVVRIVGGYVSRVDGEFLASPWRVRVDGSGRVWVFRVTT